MEDKFLMYKKWFWVGIAVGFLNGVAGLVYGIALASEPEHRKEGWVIIGWSVLMFLFTYSVAKYLQSVGVIPNFVITPSGPGAAVGTEVDIVE